MPSEVFRTGTFKGVDIHDAFAVSASQQQPVMVNLGSIPSRNSIPSRTGTCFRSSLLCNS
jgi:hypothetical protein